MRKIAMFVLLLCFAGCSPNRARLGTYAYSVNGTDVLNHPKTTTYQLELKSNDECVISETGGDSPPNVTGKYTITGDTIAISYTMLGTNVVANAHFENQTIILDDRSMFSSGMRLTKGN